MQNLRVALVQADQKWEDKSANFRLYEKLLSKLNEVDLILLPEMFNTSFSIKPKQLAEEMNNSKSVEWLKKKAKKMKAAIYTSLIIKENNFFFNRGVFITPNEQIHFYDKRKCFSLAKEDLFFQTGDKETIVHYLGWKINLQICYDLRFPLNVLNSIDKKKQFKYDVLLYVANWPEKRIGHWNKLLVGRAIENQCFVLGVNRTGIDGNQINYCGNSMAIDANGEEMFPPSSKENVFIFTLKRNNLEELRKKLPFIKDQ